MGKKMYIHIPYQLSIICSKLQFAKVNLFCSLLLLTVLYIIFFFFSGRIVNSLNVHFLNSLNVLFLNLFQIQCFIYLLLLLIYFIFHVLHSNFFNIRIKPVTTVKLMVIETYKKTHKNILNFKFIIFLILGILQLYL